MKILDLTQFYAPRSGGVKRYLHEKIRFIQACKIEHEHVLVVPGSRTGLTSDFRSRIYSIASPRVPRSCGYRALVDLRAVDKIIERERPDIIESADPYQLGWRAVSSARMRRIPAVGFYHSHFPEAYLQAAGRLAQSAAQRYVKTLYNRFAATLVPSNSLAATLHTWGVQNAISVLLGVDDSVFRPGADSDVTRRKLGVAPSAKLLLYVGRLAEEKNTRRLFEAFEILQRDLPKTFHLLVIGDGPERGDLQKIKALYKSALTVIPYCGAPAELASYYGAADLFVHPGTRETFGLVALESQACGTPVVGIRGSRLDDVILHAQESWATENNAEALAAAIVRMSTADLRQLGAAASLQAREQFSWTSVFERLFCIYREVCANYASARATS